MLITLFMFHFESITAQLNETAEKNKKNFEQQNQEKYQYWYEFQASLSSWILKIDQDFIDDKFNCYGIQCNCNIEDVMNFLFYGNYSTKEIMDIDSPKDFSLEHYKHDPKLLELYNAAYSVFVQIHQRFATSPSGLQLVKRKYESGCFGQCPRFGCDGQHLLPFGFDYEPGKSMICGWCPRCNDIYDVNSEIDGAFYGPTFPHFFLQMSKSEAKNKPQAKVQLTYFGIPLET